MDVTPKQVVILFKKRNVFFQNNLFQNWVYNLYTDWTLLCFIKVICNSKSRQVMSVVYNR